MLAARLYWAPGAHAWQAGSRIPVAHWLGYPMLAETVLVLGSPHPGIWCLYCLSCTRKFKPIDFAVPQIASKCQKPTATLASEPQAPATLLAPKSLFHTEHGGPLITSMASCGRAPAAISKSRDPAPPLSGNLPVCGY
jgi:hypothetical protein